MMYARTAESRQIFGRIDEGDDLIRAIEECCVAERITAGWVRATGTLSHVRLVVEERAGQPVEEVELHGEHLLIGFDGAIARVGDRPVLRAVTSLHSRESDDRAPRAGTVAEATSVDVEFWIQAFQGIDAHRELDGSGRFLLRFDDEIATDVAAVEPSPRAATPARAERPARPIKSERSGATARADRVVERRPEPTESAATARSGEPSKGAESATDEASDAAPSAWDKAVRISEQLRKLEDTGDDAEVDVDELSPGDILQHPTLGECTIVKTLNDDAIYVRLASAHRRKLVTRVFRILEAEARGERRVFRLEKR